VVDVGIQLMDRVFSLHFGSQLVSAVPVAAAHTVRFEVPVTVELPVDSMFEVVVLHMVDGYMVPVVADAASTVLVDLEVAWNQFGT